MKTIKLWLTAIAALLCSLTANAEDFSLGGIYYNITSSADLTVEVTYRGSSSNSYSNEYSGAVTIPSTATYNSKTYSVTSIGENAFSGCYSLTSITIPESVTSIGEYAFSGCYSLTSITIPESVTSIGEDAFSGCSSLTSITIPESVTSIGEDAFSGCSSLTSITIPEGVTSIGEYAFNGCSSLTSITIPNSVTSIGSFAFSGCSSLASITIPEGVTSIERNTFYACSCLTSITIPEGVTSIGNSAFYGCSSLTSITIPEGVTSIGSTAFRGCRSLTSITIPESVTSIESYAFYGCSSLTSITIPESVTSIGDYAFFDCSSLYSVTVGSGVLSIGSNAFRTPKKVIWLTNTPPSGYGNTWESINYVANDQYTSLNNVRVYPYLSSMFEVDGVKYVPVSPSERTCHAIDCTYDESVATINVGETASFKGVAMKVTEVMPYTFYSNDHIKEVAVSHLGDIGDYAFYDCDAIETVDVSNQGGIGVQAFYNCDAIETVDVSNQGNIGNQAFYDCNGIKSVDIRNQGSIGNQAFYGCNGMEAAIVASYIPTSPSVDNTPLTFASWTSTNHSHSSTSSETYTFTAGEGATLSFCWSVSSEASYDELIVTLDGTTILEKSGIQSGTYNNTISKGLHTLVVKYTKDSSDSSGSDQASVSNIAVGKGGATTLIAEVGSEAFSGCSSLKMVTLGDSIGSLGDKAFYQCSSLLEIVIPDSVKSVGTYCFSGCSAMKSAVIGDGVGNVQGYTFENCTALTDVTVGDGVTTISNYAFTGCSALTYVELGSSVATINNGAFRNCSSLPEIILPQAVTKVGDYVFAGCSKLADVVIADRTTALALGSNGSSPLFVDCPLDSVYIGGKISYSTTSSYGYSPFYRNTSLRTVVITDREEQIYGNEFYGCTSLKNVAIGNGVKSIGNYAFSGCSSLDKFAFGSSMQRIGEEAFSDCTNLTEICSSAMNPPTCGTQALDDINKWNCILKVPTGYMAAYQAADQWKEFFFIEDIVEVATYTLTFMVDGEVYHTVELPCEAAVTMPATPTKEGHTFSGWDKTLSTMPAEDVTISGTFTINKYLVTFKVDGEIVYSESLEYGASIVAPDAPEKEGHTFNGWGEVDTTVPAHDVTYEANYSVNSYQLTYVVDGETVQTESVAYGTAITLIDEPVKEGYTFSGWGEVPETMPAHDVTLNGTFTINKYIVTFTVDGAVIASDSLEYGTAITVPTMPEREGYTFSGWSEVAETVPAHDVTYDASYTANIYKVYYFVGATLVHTAEVAYGEAIPEYIYEPTTEGDVFLGWVGETYETMPAHDVTYTANIDDAIEQLTIDKSQLTIYDLKGRKVTDTENLKGGIYIVNGKKVVIE